MNFSGGLNIPIADREKRKNSKNRFDPVEPYIYMKYYINYHMHIYISINIWKSQQMDWPVEVFSYLANTNDIVVIANLGIMRAFCFHKK